MKESEIRTILEIDEGLGKLIEGIFKVGLMFPTAIRNIYEMNLSSLKHPERAFDSTVNGAFITLMGTAVLDGVLCMYASYAYPQKVEQVALACLASHAFSAGYEIYRRIKNQKENEILVENNQDRK